MRIEKTPAVDPHRARLETSGDFVTPSNVTREDTRRESVPGRVRAVHDFVDVGKPLCDQNRAENLFVSQRMSVLDPLDHRRRTEESALASIEPACSGSNAAALLGADTDEI